jgi:aspartate aminotransferase
LARNRDRATLAIGTVHPDMETATAARPRERGGAGEGILAIAAQVAAARASGRAIVDLTIGDYDPLRFRPPRALFEALARAWRRGRTSYPPPAGVWSLREAVADHYRRRLGLVVPPQAVLVQAGARPLIYACYRLLVQPGDGVVFPVPSWNNGAYCAMVRARPVGVTAAAESDFIPDPVRLATAVQEASLVVLNSPANPTGKRLPRRLLELVARAIVDENGARARAGRRPVFLLYDQVYWPLVPFREHLHPAQVVPQAAEWTVTVDAISKSLCATGLRVGWAALPAQLVDTFSAYLSDVGSWAPTAEQEAVAEFLSLTHAFDDHAARLRRRLQARVELVVRQLERLRVDGFDLEFVRPDGGFYVTARFAPRAVASDPAATLLETGGVAVVPLRAFDAPDAYGWCRLATAAASWGSLGELSTRLSQVLSRRGQPVSTFRGPTRGGGAPKRASRPRTAP